MVNSKNIKYQDFTDDYGSNYYYKKFSSYPDLTKEEENFLFKEFRNADNENLKESIRDKILKPQYKYVVGLAAKCPGDLHDNVSKGMFGLLRAFEKYDFERGNRFITYAKTKIFYSMVRFDELSEELIKNKTTRKAITVHSLDQLMDCDAKDNKYLADKKSDSFIKEFELKELRNYLNEIIEMLPKTIAKNIIRARILNDQKATFEDLAQNYDRCPASLFQREKNSLRFIKYIIESRYMHLRDFLY